MAEIVDESGWTVFCSGCSLKLDEPFEFVERDPCPECGSRARYMRHRDSPDAGVMISEGERRSRGESRVGDIVSAEGHRLRIHRIINRRRNLYYEKVHDPETREVLREVEEPLTEHRGRGDAKRKLGA